MLFSLIAFTVLFPTFSGEAPFQEAASWKGKFSQEAPKAWEQYFLQAKGLQGAYSILGHDLKLKKKISEEWYELKQRPDCALILEENERSAFIMSTNPKYSFILNRPKKEGKWVVVKYGDKLFKPFSLGNPNCITQMVSKFPFTFGAVAYTLQVTVLDSGFNIKKVIPINQDGRDLIQVDFDYSPPRDRDKMPLRGGSVIFDPDRYWTISRYNIDTLWGKQRGTDNTIYEYNIMRNNFPILKKIVRKRINHSQKIELEHTWEFDLKEKDVSEREFRLSNFGFPEPQGIVWEKGPRWYLWFMAVAFLGLGLGWYCWRRVNQRKLALAQARTIT